MKTHLRVVVVLSALLLGFGCAHREKSTTTARWELPARPQAKEARNAPSSISPTQNSNATLETGKLYRESADQSIFEKNDTLYVNGPSATGNTTLPLKEQKTLSPTSTGGQSRRYGDEKSKARTAPKDTKRIP
jgi:hypothetical protein